MDLIDRYLYAIGRRLPTGQRADILAELRASLEDDVEARSDGTPDRAVVVDVIREMGPPGQVAAAYHPTRQYLIGPELFPLFRLVLGIVFSVTVGIQLGALLLPFVLQGQAVEGLSTFWGLLGSLPSTLGLVVVTFAALQVLDVRPEMTQQPFDPSNLPPVERDDEPVSRFEQIFEMVFTLAFLTILAALFQGDRGVFVDLGVNGIVDDYFPWIALVLGSEVILAIVLLWRGHWQVVTRVAAVLANVLTLVLLASLIQTLDVRLAEHGVAGLFGAWAERMPELVNGGPLAVMVIFRFGLAIAAAIVALETFVYAYRLVRAVLRSRTVGGSSEPAV